MGSTGSGESQTMHRHAGGALRARHRSDRLIAFLELPQWRRSMVGSPRRSPRRSPMTRLVLMLLIAGLASIGGAVTSWAQSAAQPPGQDPPASASENSRY